MFVRMSYVLERLLLLVPCEYARPTLTAEHYMHKCS